MPDVVCNAVVYKGVVCHIRWKRNTYDRPAKTALRPAAVAKDPARPGSADHRGGLPCVPYRDGGLSEAAIVGGTDVPRCDPDERRPVAQGDPRLSVRDVWRRVLWRRHRGAD